MSRVMAGAVGLLLLGGCIDAGRLEGHRSLNDTAHGYAVTEEMARAGTRSQRFEVRAGDCGAEPGGGWSDCANDRERSEISLNRRWSHGQTMWIGFSVFLPEDFPTSDGVRTTIGQIHQSGGPRGTAGGLPSFPPLMQMEMQGDRYFLRVHLLSGSAENVRNDARDFDLIPVGAMRGRWTDIAIGFDTAGGTERLEVLVNGEVKASIADWIVFRPREYYFKYGIYRSFVSRHGGPMPTQILYVDEVRMGRDLASVTIRPDQPVD